MTSGGGRPTGGYFNADGDKLPSVTTITGRGKDTGGLVYVAKRNWHEAGRKGLPFERDAYWSDGDALQAGTLVHDWIEDDLHGLAPSELDESPDAETMDQAEIGFTAYLKWRKQVDLHIVATEVPLVSEEHQFGGTLDAIAVINGDRVLLDWKTSNATYQDYIAQLAAYRQLWNEHHRGEGGWVAEGYLLRVGKEFGDFHVHYWPEAVLDIGWRWFLAAKELYELDRRLKKVAA